MFFGTNLPASVFVPLGITLPARGRQTTAIHSERSPMFLIRSIAQAQAGRRDEAVALLRSFANDGSKELGMSETRILTGSIGPADSTVVTERLVNSLAEFEQGLEKVNKWSGMARYGQKFGELFIAGSHRFEVLRVHA